MSTAYRPPPIFIVGVPRSGTTLLAAMINAHRRIGCGNETHFFERLNGAISAYLTDARHWPDRAVSYMSSLDHMGNPLFKLYQVDLADYRARLVASRPTVSAILACFMDARLASTGKARWAEKTPGHLLQLKAIRTYFPASIVICLFRDPRDVALSLLNVPWGTSRFLDGLILWRSYYTYYKNHIQGARHTLTVRYEDLVREPVRTARAVCTFIGEEFDEGMLDTSRSAQDVGAVLEDYKRQASAPADASRAYAWEAALDDAGIALCDRLLRHAVTSLGYPAPTIPDLPEVSVYPFDQCTVAVPSLSENPRCPADKGSALAWR